MIALAAVIPVYNEQANLAALAAEWLPALRALDAPFAVWFIDDGSTDASPEILQQLANADPEHIRRVRQTNQGHGAACRRGYECALAAGAEWVLQIDSDGQCDPAYLGEFWRRRLEAACVFGDRRRRGDGWHRRAHLRPLHRARIAADRRAGTRCECALPPDRRPRPRKGARTHPAGL
jgi:dolichol-phosphate mannosyltransferase